MSKCDLSLRRQVFLDFKSFSTGACFGERDYKKHFNLAIVESAQGGLRSILDYVRRAGWT